MIRAIAFDAYGTLFDVYSVGALAEQRFPGKGAELAALWRDVQVGYTRLRTLSNRHADFWQVSEDALVFSARKLGLDLTDDDRRRLMSQYACLSAFPENLSALKELKKLGLPLAILSNGTPDMLDIAVKSAGMTGLFDYILSVEAVKKYKTAPEAYQLGPDAFKLPTREILFVSSNCWDAIGAAWFGYTTFWINRSGQPLEELGAQPAAQGRLLTDVVAYVKNSIKEPS
ncbi:MAG: haloacid dehalogenase type II [Zoogloeaceae bacterium]|nr:haloacid dehalogenase type II [Zoogloeaceae bacterium]MCK6384996.1 haloacid dehalogenase type II [Rhodocyclaceae bacterium]